MLCIGFTLKCLTITVCLNMKVFETFDVYVYSRISMHDGLLQKNDVLSFFSLEKVLKEI